MLLLLPFLASADGPKVTWPPTYHIQGTWSIPYQRLHQPFDIHTDTTKGLQADLTFGGLQRNVHKLGNRTYQIQVADTTTSCLFSEVSGSDSLTEYLPNLSNATIWHFDGETVILGQPSYVWTRSNVYNISSWFYKFYVQRDTLTPLRYWQHGRSIRHSHPADYYLDFSSFGPTIDPSVFIVPIFCHDIDSGGPTRRLTVNRDISASHRARNVSTRCPVNASKLSNPNLTLPASFSWRSVPNVLQAPRDQAVCGSCWAQGAANAASAQFSLLLNGSQVSVQQFVDCTWGHSNYACQGGHADDAFWWFKNLSLPIFNENDYPYVGIAGYCQRYATGGPFTPVGRITGCWETPQYDDNYLKQAVYQRGPLAVSILASLDSFVNWQPDDKAPYHDPKCNSDAALDHVVLVTGWRDYGGGIWGWEIQNSWSSLWGDHGYGYIRGGVDESGVRTDCGITLNAFQPEVALF